MDSPPNFLPSAPSPNDGVDPFLKEALQNPRHRLTVLRMELDIKRFMLNSDQHQFEFQHFPTSYLRLAAHRVAQHYGLQSMVLDTGVDGVGNKIVVRKTTESRCPTICLSEIAPKQPENDIPEQVKIAIRPRANKGSQNDMNEIGNKQSTVRTVEERKEEYDRARARIFSGSSNYGMEGSSSQSLTDGRSLCLSRVENVAYRNTTDETDKNTTKDNTSRVAIFRDKEKDRSDPDYDRSYDRYVRSLPPNQSVSLGPYTVLQPPPFIQYESGFPQLGQVPRAQMPMNYRPSNTIMNPFCAVGPNQTSRDAVYFQWPSPAMMYAHSYDHFRHTVAQAPYQQPLSFDYLQNH